MQCGGSNEQLLNVSVRTGSEIFCKWEEDLETRGGGGEGVERDENELRCVMYRYPYEERNHYVLETCTNKNITLNKRNFKLKETTW